MIVTNGDQGVPLARALARLFRRRFPGMIFVQQDAEGAILIIAGKRVLYVIYADGTVSQKAK